MGQVIRMPGDNKWYKMEDKNTKGVKKESKWYMSLAILLSQQPLEVPIIIKLTTGSTYFIWNLGLFFP